MKNKKSLAVYFLVVVLLVVVTYGLRSTFAFFVANEQGTATDIKVAKLNYTMTSDDLVDGSLSLKPYEIKKINITLTNDYDVATIYRLNYEGNVNVSKSSSSSSEVKGLINSKESSVITLVLENPSDQEQSVRFTADGGYVGNELDNGNIAGVYDETLLQNKLLVDGTLTQTDLLDYRDLVGTNNYINVEGIMYRVLGVYRFGEEKYLKVITNETIGQQLFGLNNDYLTSSLNNYLNAEYKEALSPVLKNNVKEVTYYTAGVASVLENKNEYYSYERGSSVAGEGFNSQGLSSLGVMYLSDYVYAENWLKKPYTELTIVPNVADANKVFCISYREDKNLDTGVEVVVPINEIISECAVGEAINVRPVMYLDNKLVIQSGTGTEIDPYIVR